jgi:hypothetical protein
MGLNIDGLSLWREVVDLIIVFQCVVRTMGLEIDGLSLWGEVVDLVIIS